VNTNNKILSLQDTFLEKYGRGTVIQTVITDIILPSQIVTQFYEGFIGRLSILDISWSLPEAEKKVHLYKKGETIECVVLDIDFDSNQVKLGQKHLSEPLSETIKWERIENGDEFHGTIHEELYNSYLISTRKNIYGILHKSLLKEKSEKLKVKVSSKLAYSELLSFVPATLEIEDDSTSKSDIKPEHTFIEPDLTSYGAFKKSLLGISASDENHEIISKGFKHDNKIFSKEISTQHTLYLQFELNSSAYEVSFKQNAVAYFLENETFSTEVEKILLEKLSNQSYWFKLNKQRSEFSIYNEDVNFFGDIKVSSDNKELRFVIKSFSVGRKFFPATEAKKRYAKYGSFLLSNALRILSPFETLPLGNSQEKFAEFVTIKTDCFSTINNLKKDASEILRQEGRTLAIIDRFLDFQLSLVEEQKEQNVFVEKYEQVPSATSGVSILLNESIGDSLELEEESVVNIRLKKDGKLLKLSSGVLTYSYKGCTLNFFKSINLSLLDDGFYIDKRIDKKQFLVQKEIIKDFLDKKIKIDHIESLLVKPDRIKSPVLSRIELFNEDLKKTAIDYPDNNQINAVRKAVGNKNIYLIQGPPGTGKTTVISEIIQQLILKGEKVLVSGQNHVSVDNVLEKTSMFHHLNLLRIGNPERVNKDLVRFNIDYLIEEYNIDFKTFINNQLLLTKKYLELVEKKIENINPSYNKYVNELILSYGKLRNIFKDRHFNLRDGLKQLNISEIDNVINSLTQWKDSNNNEYEILLKPLICNSVDVVFATCIGIKTDKLFSEIDLKFDTVIIDEAGKANIAETLVAIELGKKVIMVGDQMQLPPYMDSSLIDVRDPNSFPNSKYGSGYIHDEIVHALKSSFFEFIVNRIDANQFPDENKELLNYQHRMHPNIGEFVSNSFYGGKVKMGSQTYLNKLELPSPFNKEIIFFDTSNSEDPYEQSDGYSAKNNTEAETISEFVLPRLFEQNVSYKKIAIIAPYKSQVTNIKKHINSSLTIITKNIDVSTLDSFQGREYDIIIFSFTRSVDHSKAPFINGRKKFTKVGFLDDARRLNVAFSRAKKKLILVGNAVTLTDRRSHFDGFFPYSSLFRKLVSLSKSEGIGNFVNIADFYGFKNPFEEFIEKYRISENATGLFKMLGKNDDQKTFGLFIKVGRMDCLLPVSFIPAYCRKELENLQPGKKIKVKIHQIDKKNERVTLKLTDAIERYNLIWKFNIGKVRIGEHYTGEVIQKAKFGYFVQLKSGLTGLLHNNKLGNNSDLKEYQKIRVKIFNINHHHKKIEFSI
jgi:superfamily I DNA and/or RNA helicase/DNA-directed RNA polymerase subunit E'/Rpb7